MREQSRLRAFRRVYFVAREGCKILAGISQSSERHCILILYPKEYRDVSMRGVNSQHDNRVHPEVQGHNSESVEGHIEYCLKVAISIAKVAEEPHRKNFLRISSTLNSAVSSKAGLPRSDHLPAMRTSTTRRLNNPHRSRNLWSTSVRSNSSDRQAQQEEKLSRY